MMKSMAAVTMPSLFFKAEQQQSSAALDVSADRSAVSTAAGSVLASRPRRDFVFVVNPMGANGQTGREWKKLLPYLNTLQLDNPLKLRR